MKILRIVSGLLTAGFSSVLLAAPGTSFDLTGTITSDFPPPPTSVLSGTLTLNTVTGTFVSADVDFTSPNTSIPTVPALTNLGPATAPGPAGSHFYEIELCAVAECAGSWVLEVGLNVQPTAPSLIGYTGGSIATLGLFYSTIADTWGGCSSGCGNLSSAGSTGGGTSGGSGSGGSTSTGSASTSVPEPGTYALMLLGFAAVGLTARRRKAAWGASARI
jgi:hypothetical protein